MATLCTQGLVLREEDGRVFVGRVDRGHFLEVDAHGGRILGLLVAGVPVAEVELRLRSEGLAVDVADFLVALEAAGLALDAKRDDGGPAAASGMPRAWFRIALGPLADLLTAGLLLAALANGALAAVPTAVEALHAQAWTWLSALSVVAMFGLTLIAHEASHFLVAWAHALPARICLSTRLDDIVLETRVPALWSLPRAQRLRFYLAGIRTDLAVASLLSLSLVWVEPGGAAARVIGAGLFAIGLRLAFETLVFARTDLYFVLMEVLRLPNLRDDAIAWLRASWRGRGGSVLAARSAPERRRIVAYAVFLALAMLAFLALILCSFLPYWLGLMAQAWSQARAEYAAGELLRAAQAFALLAGVAGMWLFFGWILLLSTRRR